MTWCIITIVKENLNQLNDSFKMLINTHQQHNDLLPNEEKHTDNQCIDEIDEKVFLIKHQTYNWTGENKDDQNQIQHQIHKFQDHWNT